MSGLGLTESVFFQFRACSFAFWGRFGGLSFRVLEVVVFGVTKTTHRHEYHPRNRVLSILIPDALTSSFGSYVIRLKDLGVVQKYDSPSRVPRVRIVIVLLSTCGPPCSWNPPSVASSLNPE